MSQEPLFTDSIPVPDPVASYVTVTFGLSAMNCSDSAPITSSIEVEPFVATVPDRSFEALVFEEEPSEAPDAEAAAEDVAELFSELFAASPEPLPDPADPQAANTIEATVTAARTEIIGFFFISCILRNVQID